MTDTPITKRVAFQVRRYTDNQVVGTLAFDVTDDEAATFERVLSRHGCKPSRVGFVSPRVRVSPDVEPAGATIEETAA